MNESVTMHGSMHGSIVRHAIGKCLPSQHDREPMLSALHEIGIGPSAVAKRLNVSRGFTAVVKGGRAGLPHSRATQVLPILEEAIEISALLVRELRTGKGQGHDEVVANVDTKLRYAPIEVKNEYIVRVMDTIESALNNCFSAWEDAIKLYFGNEQ